MLKYPNCTDIRSFHHFGRSCGTCYGPVAENIHGATPIAANSLGRDHRAGGIEDDILGGGSEKDLAHLGLVPNTDNDEIDR